MRAGTRVRVAVFVAGVVLLVSPEARAAAAGALDRAGLELPTAAASTSSAHSAAATRAARAGERAGKIAEQQRGKPYVFGADARANGGTAFDCSELVIWSWNHAGASWPDTTANGLGTHWPAVHGRPRPGDLLVWDFGPGSRVAGYDHVAIVTTGGRFVEAYTTGVPVRIRSLAGAHATKIVRPTVHW